ncbi:MAG: hypothetical protein WBN78_11105 [Gammaproteobacteria bacterium]
MSRILPQTAIAEQQPRRVAVVSFAAVPGTRESAAVRQSLPPDQACPAEELT